MKAYPKLKDSGVRWIGKIPAHWDSVKIKYSDNVIMGQSPSSDDYNQEQIGLPFLQGNADFTELHPVPRVWCNTANKITQNGDLLLSVRAPVGAVNIADQAYGIGRGLCAIRAEKTNPKLLFYFLLAMNEELNSNGTGSTYTAISVDDVRNIYILNIPLSEQQAIADFLDRKTAQIDTLIEKKQRQIDLLQEQRTALINHAVTKGLNPDVRMKDSGVEWLGEIPSHWTIKPLKHIKAQEENAFVDGPFGSNLKTEHFVEGGDVFVIESGFVTTGQFVTGEYKTITKEHFETIKRSECKAGDIVIAKIGARFGTSGILPELGKPCVVSGNSLKLTVNVLENSTEFIHFSLLSLKRVGAAFELIVNATAQPALSLGRMNEMKLAVPPKPEQEEIVKYIKNKSQKIDEAEDKISRHISLLQEYRTTLISEAVTGKIDVRTETVHE